MENTAVVSLTEIKTNHGADILDECTAHIPSTERIGRLVHEAVHKSGDKELAVEVLRLD